MLALPSSAWPDLPTTVFTPRQLVLVVGEDVEERIG